MNVVDCAKTFLTEGIKFKRIKLPGADAQYLEKIACDLIKGTGEGEPVGVLSEPEFTVVPWLERQEEVKRMADEILRRHAQEPCFASQDITTIIKNGRVFKYRRRRPFRVIRVKGEKG